MDIEKKKEHISLCVGGTVDSGKSTLVGRLVFELGGINDRDMKKLQDEADRLGKSSFAFAFYMDTEKEERERGITIAYRTKEFFTENFHYTINDLPGHSAFIKNFLSGSSQADAALLLVPADGNFTTSVAKGDHKAGIIQGQSRQHARLFNLMGIKQLIVGINKMDCDLAKFGKERYEEIMNEVKDMLVRVGWPKPFVENAVAYIPMSGYKGDNLIKESINMPWWNGMDVVNPRTKEKIHVHTLMDCFDKMIKIPPKALDKPFRMPVSDILKIKGVGDVITGRIEQGTLSPGTEVRFIPSDTESTSCVGKVFSIEMHHKSVEKAIHGDNVGVSVKGLDKSNMPKIGDVMIIKNDKTLAKCNKFVAQIQVLDHPGKLSVGYCPIVYCRTAKTACRMTAIRWRKGKETNNEQQDNPAYIKSNDMAEVEFVPQKPFCVEAFSACEPLARIAVMEGKQAIFLGKVMSWE